MNCRKPKTVDTQVIFELAKTARIELDNSTAEALKRDIETVLNYAAQLEEYTGGGDAPDALPVGAGRDDVPQEPALRDALLGCAAETEDGCYRLPCVIPPSETEDVL